MPQIRQLAVDTNQECTERPFMVRTGAVLQSIPGVRRNSRLERSSQHQGSGVVTLTATSHLQADFNVKRKRRHACKQA